MIKIPTLLTWILLPGLLVACSGDESSSVPGSSTDGGTSASLGTTSAGTTGTGPTSAAVTNAGVTSGATDAATTTATTTTVTTGASTATTTASDTSAGNATNGGETSSSSSASTASGTETTGAVTTSSTSGAGGAESTATTSTATTASSTTGGMDDGDCMTPPPAPPLVGWASEAGGTMGGGNATPTVVTSASELTSAASGNDARVIHVNGSLSGSFSIGSNKTIIGVCGAELRGAVSISGQQNIILRNIKVIGYNCSDSPDNCSDGADAIGVRSSHHLWFDHLEVSDGSDGNLDMTNNSDYITISWTKFFYSTARTDPEQGESGHRFSNLIGGSDSDAGEYRITFHHNWWAQNVDQRMPRSRFGDIHVFNNLFTSSGNSYCTNAGIDTHLLVENNIYRGVNDPLSPDANGDMRAVGNVFDDTTGNQSDNGGTGFDPPYDYTLDATSGLDSVLEAEVGPHD